MFGLEWGIVENLSYDKSLEMKDHLWSYSGRGGGSCPGKALLCLPAPKSVMSPQGGL